MLFWRLVGPIGLPLKRVIALQAVGVVGVPGMWAQQSPRALAL